MTELKRTEVVTWMPATWDKFPEGAEKYLVLLYSMEDEDLNWVQSCVNDLNDSPYRKSHYFVIQRIQTEVIGEVS